VSSLSYDQVIATSQAKGGPAVQRWADVANTWFATGWVALSLFFVQFSQYAGGEAKDVRRDVPIAILGSHTFAAVMMLIMALVMMKTWGFDFLAAIYHLFSQHIDYPFSIEPTFTLLSAMLTASPVLIFVIGLGFTLWSVAAIVFNHLANSRCILAWTMDRVLPAKLGDVSDRFHTPVPAIVLSVVVAQIWLTYYSFAGDRLEFLGGTTLGYMLGFMFTAIAGVVFPYRRKELYDSSPARLSLFGVPLITLLGIGTIIYFITLMYGFLTNDALLANTPRGLVFMAGLWVTGLVIFYVNKLVRKAQGVDVDLAYRAIPPE
jgi:amino acid transporter